MARIGIDATALYGSRTGIGVFTERIITGLADRDEFSLSAFAVTFRGRGRLESLVPAGVRAVKRPMAAQPLRRCWLRSDLPPIEWFTGPLDLVHGPNFVVPPARRAARLVTVHDITPWRFPELANADTQAYPALVARAVNGGAWVHTVSEFVADELRELFPSAAERIRVVANGVTPLPPESPATNAQRGAELAGGTRYVLGLGTVEPRKDFPGLVAAFDQLAADDPDVRLVIAGGSGWGVEALTKAIASAARPDRIVRLGWVSDEDRIALLRGATVFAYPSLYEGFGLPPLEAMLAGTPVVATRAGALPEVIGNAAEFVEPGDNDELASALGLLLDDESRRAELATAGSHRSAKYNWANAVDGLADLYLEILR